MTIRRFTAALSLAALLASGAALAAPPRPALPVAREPFKVTVDQTVTLKIGSPAESVVIGNASIADVAVFDSRTLLVTGKSFGSTNMLVLDHTGRTVYAAELTVTGPTNGALTIVRNDGVYSYSCTDKCRPTPMAGDNAAHFQTSKTTAEGKAQSAQGTGG